VYLLFSAQGQIAFKRYFKGFSKHRVFEFLNIVYFYIYEGLPRSEEEREKIASKAKEHLGYKNPSLLDISPESIVNDILHKFLRVTDVLVNLLLDGLFRSDKFYTLTLFNSSTHTNLSSLSYLLSEKCYLKSLETGAKQEDIRNYFKSLMGPKKRILFEIITTNNCISKFQHLYKKIEISRLWACYWSILKF
jgi:hypothetical protein